jgi:hypothetical protein
LEHVPDGVITIEQSNPKKLKYRIGINDYSYF